MPDWLGELSTAQHSQEGSTDADRQDWLPSADLPGWVQALRPVETVAPMPPATNLVETESRVEDRGPLAGLRGILPGEPMVIPAVAASVFATRLEVTEQQSQHAEIFQKLLEAEEQPEPLRPSRPSPASVSCGWRSLECSSSSC